MCCFKFKCTSRSVLLFDVLRTPQPLTIYTICLKMYHLHTCVTQLSDAVDHKLTFYPKTAFKLGNIHLE